MVLRRIASHDQDHVGVLDVDPVVGHRPTTECGAQTGHRGAMSKPGLVVGVHDPQRACPFGQQVVDLVVIGAATNNRDALALIESLPGGVLFDEAFIARLLHSPGDLIYHPLPALLLPSVGAWGAVERAGQATFVEDVVFERNAFGAERAAIDRMVWVALD